VSGYRKGATYEREVRALFEENGYEVSRAAGSKGAMGWDLIARKRTGRTTREVWLQLFIQAKIRKAAACANG